MQGMQYLVILVVSMMSIQSIGCEIYQGNLSVDFKCLKFEVKQLSQIVEGDDEIFLSVSPEKIEEAEIVLSSSDSSKVIQ